MYKRQEFVPVKQIEMNEIVNSWFTISVYISEFVPILILNFNIKFMNTTPINPAITLAGTSIFRKKGILALKKVPKHNAMLANPNATIKLFIFYSSTTCLLYTSMLWRDKSNLPGRKYHVLSYI